MPATIETNKILAPFFIPEANIFVPYVLDFLFLIYVAIVSESPSRDLLKSASYIEAIIVFLSLMNKKKKETQVEKVAANAQKEFTVLNRPINIVAAALTRCTDAFLGGAHQVLMARFNTDVDRYRLDRKGLWGCHVSVCFL